MSTSVTPSWTFPGELPKATAQRAVIEGTAGFVALG